jgi:hypothetical protein
VRYEDVENAARQQGWTVDRTERGHRRLRPPDKSRPVVIGPGTTSRHRGRFNGVRLFLAAAKRSGLIYPWPPKHKR